MATIANPSTHRQDNWWLEPLLVFGGLGAFIVYASYRALMGFGFTDPELANQFITDHHAYAQALGYAYYGGGAHYVSPIASPDLTPFISFLAQPISQFVQNITGWKWFIISPALWILWAPGGFRATCYYYRKAYYRSFFASPPACAVGPDKGNPLGKILGPLLGYGEKYKGETAFPLILQNLHRYFFYVSALFILLLTIDGIIAFFFKGGPLLGYHIEIHLGSIIIMMNAILLALYTFSCHSYRHILGGHIDNFSSCGLIGAVRNEAWQRQSKLNEHHMLFAWVSLFWVGITDFYIWQVAQGNWPDPDLGAIVWNLLPF